MQGNLINLFKFLIIINKIKHLYIECITNLEEHRAKQFLKIMLL